jgi:LysM repeat protein
VYVGQVLSVPGMTKSAPTMKPPGSTSSGYQSCANYYTVDWGDTLSSIAWAHGTTVNELLQANSLYSEIIYEGQRLCLPGMSGQDRPQAPMGSMSMSMSAPMPSMSSDYYVVKKGDTVSAIAYRFGVSVAALIRVNNLSNTGLIYEGQKLVIAATADNPGQGSMMPNPNRPSDNHKPGSQQPGQQQSYVEIWMDNADYQDWGRPVDGLTSCTGNTGPFDDSHPIRRLTVSVYVTYHADENEKPLPSTWVNDVVFNTVGGDERIACYWPTDTRLKPGETVNVTFYTHLENDDARVKDMHFAFDAAPGTICLQPGSGMVGQCNSNERSKW